jgi:hypothetical protein
MLVPLLFCRLYLELYFRLKAPLTSEQMLHYFLLGFRNNPDSFQKHLRSASDTKKYRRLFRIALPGSIRRDVYRGWRREMERQRKWIQVLEGQRA